VSGREALAVVVEFVGRWVRPKGERIRRRRNGKHGSWPEGSGDL
jgi:hypothetical protein